MDSLHTPTVPHARKYLAAAITAIVLSPSLQAENLALEEVVVTAQKRAENLQDVPISISASTEEFIEQVGAQSLNDLGVYTPGLETNNTQVTQPSITIRGIGIGGFDTTKDPAVAVYVDGVYTRTGGAMNAFNDVERVEILKGPQGTLFGRNAAAGAVHVISKAPSTETEGKIELGLGSYGKTKFTGMYNTPLSDNLFLRLNVLDNKRDGYAENLTTGKNDVGEEKNSAARATLLWDFSDTTSITFRADYVDVDQRARPVASLNPNFAPADPYGDIRSDETDAKETLDLGGGSMTIESDLGPATFTSITAYRAFDSYNRTEEDGTDHPDKRFSVANEEENKTISQEFRFTSNDSLIKWTAGAMYSREEIKQSHNANWSVELLDQFLIGQSEDIRNALAGYNPQGAQSAWDVIFDTADGDLIHPELGPLPDGNIRLAGNVGYGLGAGLLTAQSLSPDNSFNEKLSTDLTSVSKAVYGDMTYPVTDRLNATAGLRYTWDNKEVVYNSKFNQYGLGIAFDKEYDNVKKDDNWNKLTKRFVLDYGFNDDTMGYLSYTEGYKSGGLEAFDPSKPSFDEENVVNYEIGLKSSLMDNRVRFSAALFQYDYTDLQNIELVDLIYRNRSTDVEGKGIELEAIWRATERLTLTGNYSYLKSEYTKYQILKDDEKNLKGEPQSGVPKHKFNLAANYVLPLSSDIGELEFNLAYSYVGKRSLSANYTDNENTDLDNATGALLEKWNDDMEDPYSLVNARATFFDASGHWKASLYATNLTNEKYLVSLGGYSNQLGLTAATRGTPRMYGLDVSYTF